MPIQTPYQPRPIRFIEIAEHQDWKIKIYSISVKAEHISPQLLAQAKLHIGDWLQHVHNYPLETYQIATLILHEGREGNFAIINWWIDENMLQNHVYFSNYQAHDQFVYFSEKGIQTCVWELAVIWFERNAWVEHILKKAPNPDWDAYLQSHFSDYI